MGTLYASLMDGGSVNRRDIAWSENALRGLALGVAVFSLSELSLLFPVPEQGTALFWLAAGLTLGVLVRLPFSTWPVLLVSAFVFHVASNLNNDISLGLSIAFAASNILEAACGAALFSFWTDRGRQGLVSEAIALWLSGAVACTVGSAVGIGSLVLVGRYVDISSALALWYVSDLLGVVLVAPFTVAWWPGSKWGGAPNPRRFPAELTAAILLVVSLGYLTFWLDHSSLHSGTLLCAGMGLLVVVALRLGGRGASAASLAICVAAVSGTLEGHGPFALGSQGVIQQVTALELYLVFITLAALIPGLVVSEHANQNAERQPSRRQCQSLLNQLPGSIIITDKAGIIVEVNPAAQELLDKPEGDLLGTPLSESLSLPHNDQGGDIAGSILGGEAIVRQTTPQPIANSQGERWATFSAGPLVSEGGLVDGAVIVFSEVSLPHVPSPPLATPLSSTCSLTEQLDVVGDVAAGAAHDFNNFLTAIQGTAQLISFEASGDQKEFAEDILSATQAARDLTRRLATFRRVDDPLNTQALDLTAVIHGARKQMDRLCGARVKLEVEVGRQALPIFADQEKLEFVLFQTCLLARTHLEDGGLLSLSCDHGKIEEYPETIILSFKFQHPRKDLTPALPALLREEFAGEAPTAATSMRALLNAQGIEARLEGNHASCGLDLFLPRAPAPKTPDTTLDASGAEHAPAPPESKKVAPTTDRRHILVVDDSAALRAPLRRLLSRIGFDATSVETPALALEFIRKQSFDLVLTDLVLPGMNGEELRRELNAIAPEVPVLFMSGYGDSTIGGRLESSAGTPLLRKPFTAQELSAALDAALSADKGTTETTR